MACPTCSGRASVTLASRPKVTMAKRARSKRAGKDRVSWLIARCRRRFAPVSTRWGAAEDMKGFTEWHHGIAVTWHQVSIRPQMRICGTASQ